MYNGYATMWREGILYIYMYLHVNNNNNNNNNIELPGKCSHFPGVERSHQCCGPFQLSGTAAALFSLTCDAFTDAFLNPVLNNKDIKKENFTYDMLSPNRITLLECLMYF
jgi:hypothetical protein